MLSSRSSSSSPHITFAKDQGHNSIYTTPNRLRELANTIWKSCRPISIQIVPSGGCNEVIGLSRVGEDGTESCYVLRVPLERIRPQQLSSHVALLQLLFRRNLIPVPDIIEFDSTCANALASPYMLQDRLPGVAFSSIFPIVDVTNKCHIATTLGGYVRKMVMLKVPVAGRAAHAPDTTRQKLCFQIEPLDGTKARMLSSSCSQSEAQSMYAMLSGILSAQDGAVSAYHTDYIPNPFAKPLLRILAALDKAAWEVDNHVALCHMDLGPRNILVQRDRETRLWGATAILDWDRGLFAPQFVCCAQLPWIWGGEEDENEQVPYETLLAGLTPDARAVKEAFDRAAGPDYQLYAYTEEYRRGRQLFRCALNSIECNEDFRAAVDMIAYWEQSLKLSPRSTFGH